MRVNCSHTLQLQQIASAVNDLTTTKIIIMSSTSFYPTATKKNWKKTGDTFGTVEKGLVLDVLLLILGGDGSLT